MVISTHNVAPVAPAKPTFPTLRIATTDGMVLLFTDNKTGIVVNPGASVYKVGYHATDWKGCTSSHWTPFKPGESITITED